MIYQKPKDFYQLVNQLGLFNERFVQLKCRIADNIGLDVATSQDARMIFLDSLQADLFACNCVLNLYLDARIKNTDKDLLNIMGSFESLIERTEKEIIERDEMALGSFLNRSLLTHIHFKLEQFFWNTFRALSGTFPPRLGFLKLLRKLLQILGDKSEEEKRNIEDKFRALSFIRNSLHNNGIHRSKNDCYMIDGEQFLFELNKKIKCGSWHHILFLLDQIIFDIEGILTHDKVMSCSIIIDDFASTYGM